MTAPKTLTWDECEIAQTKAQDYLASGIAAILRHISKDGLFYMEGRNMGWRHRSGHIGLAADTARAFIDKSFPRTSQWTLHGQYDRRRRVLTFTLSHHDAPTGERYTVMRGHIGAERGERRA